MLHHYPPPAALPVVAPCPAINPTESATQAAIKSIQVPALPGFFPGKPDNLDIEIVQIIGAMLSDANSGLPLDTCRSICRSVFSESTSGKQIFGNAGLANLPTPMRRALSEISSCATSIAVAQHHGYLFLAHKKDFNALWGGKNSVWQSRWDGSGPDYILHDPGAQAFRFLEAKGNWGVAAATPRSFAKYKTQSLNAEAPLALVAGHILSYANLEPGVACSVQWFNHRVHQPPPPGWQSHALMVVLVQFIRQLTNAGHKELASIFAAPGDLKFRDVLDLMSTSFFRSGWFLAARGRQELLLGFDLRALRPMFQVAQCAWINDLAQASRLLNHLNKIYTRNLDQTPSRQNLNQLYRSATGVCVLSYFQD